MAGRLDGKVCIITGSGGAIGLASAKMFAREGAKIVGCEFNVERGEAAVREVADAGGDIVSLQPCDLTSEADCERLVQLALDTYGKLDVVYNNAAMAYFGWIDELPVEDWHRTMNEEINLVYLLCRAAWDALKASSGVIVNVSSAAGYRGFSVLPGIAHSTAKGAIHAMTRHLAMEGRHHGIRANTVSPHLIETHQSRAFLEDPAWAGPMLERVMLGRPGKPEDVAAAALFLASDEASFITGTDLLVDGGTCAW